MVAQKSVILRRNELVLFSIFQLIISTLFFVSTLWVWSSFQTRGAHIPLTYPLIVLPLEGLAIVFAIVTLVRPRLHQVVVWLLLGFFRIFASFQLLTITSTPIVLWPPPWVSFAPIEFTLGTITVGGAYTLKALLLRWNKS